MRETTLEAGRQVLWSEFVLRDQPGAAGVDQRLGVGDLVIIGGKGIRYEHRWAADGSDLGDA